MSSTLMVEVTTIDAIQPHTNANALEILIVKGWQCVVPISAGFQVGDKCVYFPPDTCIPKELSERLGVTKYLSKGRIRCARLRGEPSFGLVIRPDENWEVGTDVAEYYGATKYVPPFKALGEQQERDHALFVRYTDIDNLRNFPDILQKGELVSLTEKIHGTNCRIGIIESEKMAGSHNMRRKQPAELDHDFHGVGTYWFPWTIVNVREMLENLSTTYQQVILYGEVFGPGIQNLQYSRKSLDFRAFDLLLDGKYVDVEVFRMTCERFGVKCVPELAVIPYDVSEVARIASGKTVEGNGAHIREGVVVKPLHERVDPKIGRVVLKYVSDEYLLNQKEDFTDV